MWESKLQRFPEQVSSPDSEGQTSLAWRFGKSATEQSLKADYVSVELIKYQTDLRCNLDYWWG